MPVYSYVCEGCGLKFDRLVRKMDEEQRCTDCGQVLTQVWSVPAVAQWRCSKGSL